MNAIVLPAYGPPSAFELRDIPAPSPGPGEIEVRVVAASVNPIDWKLRSGAYQKFVQLDLPAVLGRDVSGEVVAVGAGVTAFRVGMRVLGLVNHGYAERVVAPVEAFAQVPPGLDLLQAAALPLVLLTGAQLIEKAAALRADETVLITGATGSVGRVAVFVAQERGAKVYAGVRSSHEVEAAKLGVHGVVALDDERQVEGLPEVDVLADTVGGATTQPLLRKVKRGGRVATVVGEPEGARDLGLTVRPMLAQPDSRRLGELAAEVAAKRLIVPIGKTFPLAQAAEAHELAELGGVGKVLLTM
jgi:NADPH:quinone reductase-like Zn-dependent oxidoreductase